MDYIVKIYKDWKLHSQFHEIIPDMDEDFVFNETQSIRDSARSLKKYGSTCYNQSLRNKETLVRHEVKKTDTLQGIALKYGCTTEQIRRANRLFASDSLFLRQFLLVPVEKSSCFATEEAFDKNDMAGILSKLECDKPINRVPSSLSTTSIFSSSNTSSESFSNHTQSAVMTHPLQLMSDFSSNGQCAVLPTLIMTSEHSNSDNISEHSKSMDSMASIPISSEEENRRCINEFLNKIDHTISESRKYVERSREIMMASQSDGDLFAMNNPTSYNSFKICRKNIYDVPQSSQQPSQNLRYTSNYCNNSDTTHLLNTNQMRHVQNSLKRLEQQQDEFFEL